MPVFKTIFQLEVFFYPLDHCVMLPTTDSQQQMLPGDILRGLVCDLAECMSGECLEYE